MSNVGHRRNYDRANSQRQENQEWLKKMKEDRRANTGVYTPKQGGPNVPTAVAYKTGTQAPNNQWLKGSNGQYYQPGYTNPQTGNQATDPYQLPQNKPQISSQQAPGQGQYSALNQLYGGDINKMRADLATKHPNADFSGAVFAQAPYQMPGGPGQISTDPIYASLDPWKNQQNRFSTQFTGGPAGPRPRPNMIGPRTNYAPGQQPYTGPAIAPMQRPPQSAFGQQNPTRFVPGFQPNASQGFGRGTINPYQTQQRQFRNTVW